RGDRPVELTLSLPQGWRQRGDLSWRASTRGLRRMATGGLVLEELPAEGRARAGLPEPAMALRVRHVGQYGPHAAAPQPGAARARGSSVSAAGRPSGARPPCSPTPSADPPPATGSR